jgi:hypothetical protein
VAPLFLPAPDGPAYADLLRRPEVWLPATAAVADRHGLPRPGAGDGLGGSEVVFAAGPAAVLKISCPLYVPRHEVEKRVLGRLAALPGVGAPRILAAGEIEGWPYFLLEEPVAAILWRSRSAPSARFRPAGAGRDAPACPWRTRRRRAATTSRGGPPAGSGGPSPGAGKGRPEGNGPPAYTALPPETSAKVFRNRSAARWRAFPAAS